MFHVEPLAKRRMIIGIAVVFSIYLLSLGCVGARPRTVIEDFTILGNGKAIIGTKPLHAFVFENFQPRLTFGEFLSQKFKTEMEPEGIWVETKGHRYKIILYDNSEFEKHFVVTDFIITELKPMDEYNLNQPHFIALSAIDTSNNDCLADGSLLLNTVTEHLKSLKDEYNKL